MQPWILDLETTGLETGYRPRANTTVGISEYALLGQDKLLGGYTNILQGALSKKRTAEQYHRALTTGSIQWQAGYAQEGDVLAGVFGRHVAAHTAGKATYAEAQAVQDVMDILKRGESVTAWNARFDIGQLKRTAQKLGIEGFSDIVSEAHASGRIIEGSDPVKKFLFNWAQKGKITFAQSSKSAKRMINLGKWTAQDIDTVPLTELYEENVGFKKLFEKRPNISYKQYTDEILEGDASLSFQSFGAGRTKPNVTYMRGWKQHLIAEAINPGFTTDASKTLLGQEIARRKAAMNLSGAATAHAAADDVILTQILREKFDTPDPILALRSLGVESEENLLGNYKTAWARDIRQYMKTYLGERTPKQVDVGYLGRVLAGTQMQAAAPEVAASAATSVSKLPSLKSIYMGALKEAQEMAVKYPKRTAFAGIVGGILLADAFIPEDNKLEGRRHADSKYTRIRGITFEGINSPEGTDFGSGRAIDNPSALLSYRMSQSNATKTYNGYSIAETEQAQMTWGSSHAQTAKTLLNPTDYKIVPGRRIPIPGVDQNAWIGVMDLKNYRVKADDADTISLIRRGMLHIFDKPIQVRLAGIDAPETEHAVAGKGLSLPAIQPGGLEGKKYMQKVLEQQKTLHLLLDPRRTTYGRHVGILSGSSTPNINLKMVTAGAAAALPYDNDSSNIAAFRAYEKAEAQAATSGIGMWSSKGWQAKRMMDITLGARVTNTSLTQMDRLATRAGLAEYYSLVQNLHDSRPQDPWMSEDVLSMQYLLSGMSTRDLTSNDNNRIKEYGWKRGIRDGASSYNIAGSGINPSGVNVSAFGSGWSRAGMERVLRLVNPLRLGSRLRLSLEPALAAVPPKRYVSDIAVRTGDKITASRLLKPYLNTTPGPISTPYKSASPEIIPFASSRAHKVGIRESLEYSSAFSSVNMARSHKPGWRRSKYTGAIYSAQMAVGAPYRPLNEYKAVIGPGFLGSWQEKAWKNFNSGLMHYTPDIAKDIGTAGYDALYDGIRNAGIKDVDGFLKRRGLTDSLERIRNRVTFSDAIEKGRYTKAHSVGGAFWNVGKAIWHHEPAYWKDAGMFLANRQQAFEGVSFRQMWQEEYKLTSAIWKEKVTGAKGFWGKTAGFMDYLSTDSLDPFTSKEWLKSDKVPGVSAADPKSWWGKAAKGTRDWAGAQYSNVKRHLFSPGVQQYTNAAKGWAAKNTPNVLKSVGKFGARRVGVLGLAFGVFDAYTSAPEYENQAAGAGISLAATGAGMAAWSLTSAATGAMSAAAGAKIGTAVGAALGTVVPGIGNVVGAVSGFVIGTAVALTASIVADMVVREAGGVIFKKRHADPNMQDPTYGPYIPGQNMYGGMDEYLMAGHGIQGRPEFSGFGGSLKPLVEGPALADTLGRACARIVGSSLPPRVPTLTRTRSMFKPVAGLVQCIHDNRHTAYKQMRNHAPRSMNNSRMLMAA